MALILYPTAKTTGSDKLRGALQKTVTISGQKMTLSDYLALVKKTGGFGIQADLKDPAWKETVDFDFKDVTVGGMLQVLEDNVACRTTGSSSAITGCSSRPGRRCPSGR